MSASSHTCTHTHTYIVHPHIYKDVYHVLIYTINKSVHCGTVLAVQDIATAMLLRLLVTAGQCDKALQPVLLNLLLG